MRFFKLLAIAGVIISISSLSAICGDSTTVLNTAMSIGRIQQTPDGNRIGTGFVAGDGQHIFTCAHVAVSDTLVFFPFTSEYYYRIALQWILPEYDLAVFQRTAGEQKYSLELGDFNSVRPGDKILLFGWTSDNTLTMMTSEISAIGSVLNEGEIIQFLEFDADVIPGFSGGPVFNSRGQVIAMVREGWNQTGIKGGPTKVMARAFSTDLLRILEKNLKQTTVSPKSDSSGKKLMNIIEDK
jgi:S1-C subfamily serine protease